MLEQSITALLKRSVQKNMPSGAQLASEAYIKCVGENHGNSAWLKNNFSDLVERVQITAYETYLQHEQQAGAGAFREVFLPMVGQNGTAEDLMEVIANSFHNLDRFFLGLTQSRRPRAGAAFEYVLKTLFDKLEYPFSSQVVINGKPDFLLPSADYYSENAMDCIIFTVKRTLRERWRQIVTEGTRGLGFFLATIDEQIKVNDLDAMKESRIYLVVPKRLKIDIDLYANAINVLSFEDFFQNHLDPAMTRWKRRGVI